MPQVAVGKADLKAPRGNQIGYFLNPDTGAVLIQIENEDGVLATTILTRADAEEFGRSLAEDTQCQ